MFRKYVPILREINKAGWEPVTHARIDNAPPVGGGSALGVFLERWGGEPGSHELFWTIRPQLHRRPAVACDAEVFSERSLVISSPSLTDYL